MGIMAYLTPFYLVFNPHDKLPYRSLILNDEPGIPDDTYTLEEWYCPNPLCRCDEVSLKVFANHQKMWAVDIRLSLNPQQPISPVLDIDDDDTFPVYTSKLFRIIAEHLKSDPDYVQGLRQHYDQLRAVAADPSHPYHNAVDYWGKTGRRLPSASQNRKRYKR
jgi:hypothetical protein